MTRPLPYQLWKQAEADGGTPEEVATRYITAMEEHGYLIRRKLTGEILREEALEIYTDARLTSFDYHQQGDHGFSITNRETGQVSHGIICYGRRGSGPRCQVCRSRKSEYLCDQPTGAPCKKCKGTGKALEPVSFRGTIVEERPCSGDDGCEGTGKATCSRRLCRACRRKRGKLDLCPEHAGQAPTREAAPGGGAPALIPDRDVLTTCGNADCVAAGHLTLGKSTGRHKGIDAGTKSAILLELRQGKPGAQLSKKYQVSVGTISALKKLVRAGK